MLTIEELEAYNRNGYVVPAGTRLSPGDVTALQSGLAAVLAANPDVPSDRLINCHLDGAPPYQVNGYEGFLAVTRDARILDMVQQVLGPDLILWSTHMFCKPPVNGREVPWHQDGHYWPIRPLATCTVWLALDPVDEGNGALRVIPGSHREGRFSHFTDDRPGLTLNQAVPPGELDESRAHIIALEPGQMSLHDAQLVHGSAANSSGRRRAGLAIRYMPATSCLHRDLPIEGSMLDWSVMPVSLVRGENRHPGNDFLVGQSG